MTNTGLFGSTSTATPSTATANGLFGSTSTATPSTAATSVTFGSATSTPTAAESSGVITLDNRSANTAGPRSIRFTFQWDPTQVTSTKSHTLTVRSISPESYQFLCSVKRVEDCFLFNVKCLLEKDFLAMQWVTYATINTPDGMVRNTKVVKHWPQSRMINLSDPMPSGRFSKNLSGMLAVDIVLSNDTSVLSGTFGDTSNYSHSDSILARMLDESDSHDVFFEFEVPESTYEEWEVEECDEDAGALKSDIDDHESANDENDDENASEEDVDDEDKDDEDKDDATANGEDDEIVTVNAEDKGKGIRKDTVSEGESDNNPKSSDNAKTILIPVTTTKNTRTEIVGAHKVVLSHFEYFKTMFSSSFAEGGPGIKRIKIQDTDIFCFRLLIEFLYLGRLRRGTLPMVLTEDQAKDHLPTWEDVYLVADRYDVPQLRRMAVDRILLGLDSQWAVDFLFRTAYLFEDLRLPVIRFVVRKSMSSIVNKSVQQTFYDHPECSSVFGEIIAELWAKSTL
ncbi:hypothetical protein EDD21DRAFT_393382 [Dissophora ornata]|nr:hypothetical protein EDD21DRAFT_393382 [Dissophora ornata]